MNVKVSRRINGFVRDYRKHLVDERHVVRVIRCLRRDGADDFGDSQRRNVFKKNKKKVVQGSECNL